MRSAMKLLPIACAALAFLACNKSDQPQEQNIVIDSGNIPANADIEALPPDESSATPTNELESGADTPDVNATLNNSY